MCKSYGNEVHKHMNRSREVWHDTKMLLVFKFVNNEDIESLLIKKREPSIILGSK